MVSKRGSSPRNPTGKGGFVKGVSGNPAGRVRESKEITEFKRTTYKDFIDKLQQYGAYTKAQIDAEVKRPTATMFELIFANIVRSASMGEKDARQVLLDRLWGKVREVVPDEEQSNVRNQLSALTTEDLLKLVKAYKPDTTEVK